MNIELPMGWQLYAVVCIGQAFIQITLATPMEDRGRLQGVSTVMALFHTKFALSVVLHDFVGYVAPSYDPHPSRIS